MSLLIAIFRFEWKCFFRTPAMLVAVFLYLLLGGYGIYSGHSVIDKQGESIDSIKRTAQIDYKNALKAFTDTLTAERRYQAAHAGSPYIIDYRMPRIAIDYPKAMAGLSIGLRDITPLSEKVSYSANYSDSSQEITNPILLREGNIDLSFVIVFLLPLLVIVFCYSLVSSEKEQGTHAMLIVQSNRFRQIVFYKILFRFLIIGAATFSLNAIGILCCRSQSLFFTDVLLWFFAILSYLVFWFSICCLLISLKQSSSATSFYLFGSWLLVLFIIPAIVDIYSELKHPVQIRVDIEDMERHVGEEVWYSNPKKIVLAYFKTHPQYERAFDPKDTTNNQNDAFFAAYAYFKEKIMSDKISKIKMKNDSANQFVRNLLLFSPAQRMQDILTSLAGTGHSDYMEYRRQVGSYREQWKKCFYDRIFNLKNSKREIRNFEPKELGQLIEFNRFLKPTSINELVLALLPLWGISIILSISAYIIFERKL